MTQKQKIERDRFERMAIRVAAHLTNTPAVSRYADLSDKLKHHFETLTYCELVLPLIHHDKFEKKHTIPKISITYGVSIQNVKTALKKKTVTF